jgi:urease accessory protein
MLRASIHYPAGHWPTEESADSITLDFDARHRRRIRLTSDQGEDVLVDLPKAVAMGDGDALQLEDGRMLKVKAATEPVVEVTHHSQAQLMRLAWHLGNRHLAAEIRDGYLRIRPDHVIEDMLTGFGARLVKMHLPFQPEGGAYGDHAHRHEHHGAKSHHE